MQLITRSTSAVAVCCPSASFGLVEQPRVLQRDADVGGDRRQQPLVVGVVDALPLRALHADHALARAADEDRHAQIGQRLLADDAGAEVQAAPVRRRVLMMSGLPRLDDPAGQALAVA